MMRTYWISVGLVLLVGCASTPPAAEQPQSDQSSATDSTQHDQKPTPPDGHDRFVQLAEGREHTCVLAESRHVYCWGKNTHGELGDGTVETREVPVAVFGIDDAVQIAAGDRHTCALSEDGTVWCWGRGNRGQLGRARSADEEVFSPIPQRVRGMMGMVVSHTENINGYQARCNENLALEDVEKLSAGPARTCALQNTGAVLCWGDASQIDIKGPIREVRCPYAVRGGVDGLRSAAIEQTPQAEIDEKTRTLDFASAFDAAVDASTGRSEHALANAQSADECPRERSYGDPSAANHVTLHYGGRKRTFHFDAAVAEVDGSTLKVHLPTLSLNADERAQRVEWESPQLEIELPPNVRSGPPKGLSMTLLRGPSFESVDCMEIVPRAYGRVDLTEFDLPAAGSKQGSVRGSFETTSGSKQIGAITGEFAIDQFGRAFPGGAAVRRASNRFQTFSGMVSNAAVAVRYRPDEGRIRIEMTAPKDWKPGMVDRGPSFDFPFDGQPGRFEKWNKVLVVEEFAHGKIRGGIYKKVRGGEEAADGDSSQARSKPVLAKFFDWQDAPTASGSAASPSVAEMPTGELVASFASDKVVELPSAGEATFAAKSASDVEQVEPGPMQPLGQGSLERLEGYTVFKLSTGAGLFSELSEDNRAISRQMAPAAQQAEKGARRLTVRSPRGESHFVLNSSRVGPVRHEYGLTEGYRLDRLRERFSGVPDADARYAIFPISVDLTYGDGKVDVVARSELRGEDRATFEVPKGTIDERFVWNLLDMLPWEAGYRTSFHTFTITAERPEDGLLVELRPRLKKIEAAVVGKTSVRAGAEGKMRPAWAVEVDGQRVYVDRETGRLLQFPMRRRTAHRYLHTHSVEEDDE